MFYTCKNRSGNSHKRLTRAIRRGPQTNDVAASNAFCSSDEYSRAATNSSESVGNSFKTVFENSEPFL